jgi:hypothetical protein
MLNAQQALDMLNGMGKTADEVSLFLKAKGITGRKRDSLHCPVANYLISQGGHPEASIYGNYIAPDYVQTPTEVLTPKPVYNFILDFDEGKYPELESQ